jgi:hypothetical protein
VRDRSPNPMGFRLRGCGDITLSLQMSDIPAAVVLAGRVIMSLSFSAFD